MISPELQKLREQLRVAIHTVREMTKLPVASLSFDRETIDWFHHTGLEISSLETAFQSFRHEWGVEWAVRYRFGKRYFVTTLDPEEDLSLNEMSTGRGNFHGPWMDVEYAMRDAKRRQYLADYRKEVPPSIRTAAPQNQWWVVSYDPATDRWEKIPPTEMTESEKAEFSMAVGRGKVQRDVNLRIAELEKKAYDLENKSTELTNKNYSLEKKNRELEEKTQRLTMALGEYHATKLAATPGEETL